MKALRARPSDQPTRPPSDSRSDNAEEEPSSTTPVDTAIHTMTGASSTRCALVSGRISSIHPSGQQTTEGARRDGRMTDARRGCVELMTLLAQRLGLFTPASRAVVCGGGRGSPARQGFSRRDGARREHGNALASERWARLLRSLSSRACRVALARGSFVVALVIRDRDHVASGDLRFRLALAWRGRTRRCCGRDRGLLGPCSAARGVVSLPACRVHGPRCGAGRDRR